MTLHSHRARDYAFVEALRHAAMREHEPTSRMLVLLSDAMRVRMHESGCTIEDFLAAVDSAWPGIADELTPAATPGAMAVERERKAKVSWMAQVFGRLWR